VDEKGWATPTEIAGRTPGPSDAHIAEDETLHPDVPLMMIAPRPSLSCESVRFCIALSSHDENVTLSPLQIPDPTFVENCRHFCPPVDAVAIVRLHAPRTRVPVPHLLLLLLLFCFCCCSFYAACACAYAYAVDVAVVAVFSVAFDVFSVAVAVDVAVAVLPGVFCESRHKNPVFRFNVRQTRNTKARLEDE
jgi:hypothetical protein